MQPVICSISYLVILHTQHYWLTNSGANNPQKSQPVFRSNMFCSLSVDLGILRCNDVQMHKIIVARHDERMFHVPRLSGPDCQPCKMVLFEAPKKSMAIQSFAALDSGRGGGFLQDGIRGSTKTFSIHVLIRLRAYDPCRRCVG